MKNTNNPRCLQIILSFFTSAAGQQQQDGLVKQVNVIKKILLFCIIINMGLGTEAGRWIRGYNDFIVIFVMTVVVICIIVLLLLIIIMGTEAGRWTGGYNEPFCCDSCNFTLHHLHQCHKKSNRFTMISSLSENN